jgi:hypothetical protein
VSISSIWFDAKENELRQPIEGNAEHHLCVEWDMMRGTFPAH